MALRRGMTVEVCPFRGGNSDPDSAPYDGSVGVVKLFKGNSRGLSAVVEVVSGPRRGEKPVVPAACLVPIEEKV